MRPGKLFIVSGPSGAGKGTLLAELLRRVPELWFSVSATTRLPRVGEVEGESYFFVSRAQFKSWIAHGALLEWAEVFGQYYGTPASAVRSRTDAGVSVVLDIESQGARQVLTRVPDAVTIFVTVPSLEELERRLRRRGTETPAQIARRMAEARAEIRHKTRYDYTVVNDDLSRAADELEKIVRGEMSGEGCGKDCGEGCGEIRATDKN
ncbi:MAG: guanylate kinase [Actinomycetes bacterium]|nr:guanylate kinase [Actinomycetes bacterium]